MRFFSYKIRFNFPRLKRAIRRRPITLFSVSVMSACLMTSFVSRCRQPAALGPDDICVPVALYLSDKDHRKTTVVFRNFQIDPNGESVARRYEVLMKIELFESAYGGNWGESLASRTIRIGFDRFESPAWTSVSPFNAVLRTSLCTAVRNHLGQKQTPEMKACHTSLSTLGAKAYRMTFATLDHRARSMGPLTVSSVPSWMTRPEAMVCFSLAFTDPFDWALASQEIRDLDLSEETLGEALFLRPRKLRG